jgi:signal transduction histidine kinase/CheY-like chemotaxis protein
MRTSFSSEPDAPRPTPAFLRDGGVMGELMRRHDWSRSSLGEPDTWPQSLRTVVRLMLNTGHPMYIWWGPEGACLYNDAYRESIGPERHPHSLGRPAREVWDEIWDIIGPQIQQVRGGQGATWNVNHLVPITRHGRREDVYWTYSYSPIDDESSPNGIGGVLVVCTETTAQVLANKRIAAERDQLGQLFQQAPSFMALLSGPNHRFEIANPGYLRLVGDRPLIGRPLAEALPEAVEQGYLRLLDRVYTTGEAYIAKGARFISQGPGDGAERFVDFVYQPIRGSDGRVTGIFVEGADVTEREVANAATRASEAKYRELSQTLAESNRRKDEFLATLAHELRNPLAPIRNALALQRRAADDPSILVTSREIIERQLVQMIRLVDDLLDLSRLSRGVVELRCAPLALTSVVRQAVEAVMPMVEQAGQEIVLALPDDQCMVHADDTRIVQVVTNLVNNASKFSPRGGTIRVDLTRSERQATLRVRDTGIGIPPEMVERVFDMFTQVRAAPGSSAGGLGIGLTLVRRLVEQHGGSVQAHSAGLGHGSEFTVTLPLNGAAAPTPGLEHAPPAFVARGLRILVADDNDDIARSLSLLLELSGHEVRTANDGVQAWAIAQDFQPAAMVLDIAMPGWDGHQLCRQARTTPWGRRALMVASSGWGQPADRQRSAAAGFDHHLVKPLDFAALDALLADQLRRAGPAAALPSAAPLKGGA